MMEKPKSYFRALSERIPENTFMPGDIIAALMLLTRIPVPDFLGAGKTATGRSYWAFAIIGAVVAIVPAIFGAALVAAGAPPLAGAAVIMAGIAVLTGGMHHDGLADLADSFGGDTPARRLEIMHDSSTGSFGVLALVIISIISIASLAALASVSATAMLGGAVAAASLSRGMMAVQRFFHEPPGTTGLAYEVGKPEMIPVIMAVASGLLLAMLFTNTATAIAALIIGGAATAAIGIWCRRHIGGVNGDGLGATQQISEAVMLVVMANALT